MGGADLLVVCWGQGEVHIPRLVDESVFELQASSRRNGMGTEHWSWNEKEQEY